MPPVTKPGRRVLPVSLLVEGRRCLIVGGGTVAGRKAEALLAAGAEVVLVAPELGERARALANAPGLTVVPRRFADTDLEGPFLLAIAATDDPALNRRILDACHGRGILCTCPDRGWQDGDFISPASFSRGDLTVSVSTGGASCRRARVIKEELARHVAALGAADLIVVGTDHRQSTMSQRQPLHLAGPRRLQVGTMLRQVCGLHEFLLLGTCNRAELVAVASGDLRATGILERLLGLDRLEGRHYAYAGREAFEHLALLVAGIRSQVPGETHICGQVKAALDACTADGWAAGLLQDCVGRALRIGRAIRRETASLLQGRDVEDLCLAQLEHDLGPLGGRRILVLGAGSVGRTVAAKLAARAAQVTCCHRAAVPVFDGGGTPVRLRPLADLDALLAEEPEAVVCALGGAEPVLRPAHAARLRPAPRPHVIDLGMPRNVAPEFAAAAGVAVHDLDTLEARWSVSPAAAEQALQIARHVVAAHSDDYDRIVASMGDRPRR
jgi:glutamyl-tRNA reductase